jgi:hypothetical protein
MVEQRTFNPSVLGSSPRRATQLDLRLSPSSQYGRWSQLQFQLQFGQFVGVGQPNLRT